MTLWIAGAFISLACFGFLPGFTQDLGSLTVHGLGAEAMLFGVFHVSVLHNVVHLLLGATALVAAGSDRRCRRFLLVVGLLLVALVLYGQLDKRPVVPDLVPVNAEDAWLHSLLALTMFIAALTRPKRQQAI
jgi:hypothetical protein